MSKGAAMNTSLNILIVEDHSLTIQLLQEVLVKRYSHSVQVAKTVAGAFEKITDPINSFDVILLDYHLQDGTGMDFFSRLLTSPFKDIPVIMLTAERSREILIEFLKMGGADFVQKPVQDLYILDAIIRHAVQINGAKKHLQKVDAERLAAIEAKKFMEEFIAKLGHELGTPLHHLKSSVNIALKEIGKGNLEKAVDWLSTANQSNQRMTRLVNDISDLSRLQRGKLSIQKRLANIEEIVLNAKNESQQLQTGFDGQIDISVPHIPVICDPERISQVFVNLLNNVFNHATGCSEIDVQVLEDNNHLLCRVSDNGKGLSHDEIKQIFTPFEQCNNAYNSSGTLGVGLSISRELVRLHGGEISAFPNTPKGMIFEFHIPLERGVLQ